MPFGFSWKKKRPVVDILTDIRSIIYTCARNRMSVYHLMGLGYHVIDDITEEVYDEYMRYCTHYNSNNDSRIDRLNFLFVKAEARQVRIANEWKAEYGK